MSDTLRTVQRILNKKSLDIVGNFNPYGSGDVCSKVRNILLIGPKELYFWDVFKKVGNTETIKKTHLIDGQKKS